MRKFVQFLAAAAAAITMTHGGNADANRFSDLVGDVRVGTVNADGSYDLPYILWGGEAATFHANGLTAKTKAGSLFAAQGFTFTLVNGNDFPAQVRKYLAGETPFLRGTSHMIGMAAETLTRDPRTQPVIVVQMTWSRGDHLVARKDVKTVRDLRGKTIAVQQGGPHIGMLYDVLKTAGLSRNDVRVVWTKAIGPVDGADNPVTKFEKDQSVAAAFAVTPDMIALTGGIGSVCQLRECTVEGAHVLVSTQELTRSIADVYAVRKDFYDAHPGDVAKFVAAYLKAAEDVVDAKKNKGAPSYKALTTFTAQTLGLPNAQEADGLIEDCAFVGHAGNVEFFGNDKSPTGFRVFLDASQDLAVSWGYATKRAAIREPTWDWNGTPFAGYLAHMGEQRGEKFKAEATLAELEALQASGTLGSQPIVSFSVNFEPNATEFTVSRELEQQFDTAIVNAAKLGGAALAIRGHADPAKVLGHVVCVGTAAKVLEQRGVEGSRKYFTNGREFKLEATGDVAAAIQQGKFDAHGITHPRTGEECRPRELMLATRDLSQKRANKVRDAFLAYAKKKGARVDASQVHALGAGILEPLIPVPRSLDDARQNTRVEFALVRVSMEATQPSDFDY